MSTCIHVQYLEFNTKWYISHTRVARDESTLSYRLLTCMSRGRAKNGSVVADSFDPCFCIIDNISPLNISEIGDSLKDA